MSTELEKTSKVDVFFETKLCLAPSIRHTTRGVRYSRQCHPWCTALNSVKIESQHQFYPTGLRPCGSLRRVPAGVDWPRKRFLLFHRHETSGRCDNTWNCTTEGLKQMLGCMATGSGPREQKLISSSKALWKSWEVMSVMIAFRAFWKMSRASILNEWIERNVQENVSITAISQEVFQQRLNTHEVSRRVVHHAGC